jgi:arsenate reductase
MTKKPAILFLCTGNSARSQIAEAFARYYGGDALTLQSAGTHPVGVHPNTIWAMNEVGLDISHHTSDALSSKTLEEFDFVVTLCGEARESCPVLPPTTRHEHWSLPDPAKVRGSASESMKSFRVIRCRIEHQVKDLLQRILAEPAPPG